MYQPSNEGKAYSSPAGALLSIQSSLAPEMKERRVENLEIAVVCFFEDWLSPVMGLIIGLIIGVITGLLASRKGYLFIAWVLAGGLIGLIVLAFLPQTKEPSLAPEERARLVRRGNIIGTVLSVVEVGVGILIGVMGSR